MNDIDAHVSRARDADERIHICAIHVNQSAGFMNYLANLPDVLFKQSERVRVGQHQSRDVAVSA